MRAALLLLLAPSPLFASAAEDGLKLMQAGRYEEAIPRLEEAARENPGSPELLKNLGWAYGHVKRGDDAYRCWSLLVKLDPNNPAFLRPLAGLELGKKNFPEALKLAQKALSLSPGDPDADVVEARALIGLQRGAEGNSIIERLMKSPPRKSSVRLQIGDALAEAGRLKDAVDFLGDMAKAEPINIDYRKLRARFLAQIGRLEEANDVWKWLSKREPPDKDALLQLGWSYALDQKYEEAKRCWEVLVRLEPDNPVFLRLLADMELKLQNFDRAVALAEKSRKLLPADKSAGLVMAKALLHLRRHKEALAVFDELMKAAPNDATVQYTLASYLLKLDRLDESLAMFDKLVAAYPGMTVYWKMRADVLFLMGRFDEAVTQYKLLADQDPPDARALKALADDAFNRKDWPEAQRWFRKLGQVAPLDATLWLLVSKMYMQGGESEAALAAAQRASEADPVTLEPHYARAEILEAMQRWTEARRIYEYLFRRNPNSYRALTSMARMEADRQNFPESLRLFDDLAKKFPADAAAPTVRMLHAGVLADMGRVREALAILNELTPPERPVVYRALLYHGIARSERTDSIPVDLFRSHMEAIKEAGYTPISVKELALFESGKAVPPKKPLLITFDDGRTDSLKNGDPVLKELGLKATMFVILRGLKEFNFHAGLDQLGNFYSTGRWEMQCHAAQAHDLIPVDAAGHRGLFLTHRLWLASESRLETPAEYRARIDLDYRTIKSWIGAKFAGTSVFAFALPEGDYGQIGDTNIPESAAYNKAEVAKYFRFNFVQDTEGFNTAPLTGMEIKRFEPTKDMTAKELVRHLMMHEPWVMANMKKAKLMVEQGQGGQALKVYERLEMEGIDDPELTAQKGKAIEELGDSYRAQKLYVLALSSAPAESRYQKFLDDSRKRYGPSVASGVESYSDNFSRSFTRALVRAGSPAGFAEIYGTYAFGDYAQKGAPTYKAQEGGLDVRLTPWSKVQLEGSYARRSFLAAASKNFDTTSAGLAVLPFPEMKVAVRDERANVGTAAAIAAGRTYRSDSLHLDWAATLHWIFSASVDQVGYNDSNSQKDLRLELGRVMTEWLTLSYSLWAADSAQTRPEYWTPRALREHLANATLTKTFGTSVWAKFKYGAGWARELTGASAIQTMSGSLNGRVLNSSLTLSLEGGYTRTPTFSGREVSGGISLNY